MISLALSKWTAKRMMGVRVIATPQSDVENWLVSTVRRLAEQAHIGMPEVGIFEAEEMNAFATGARRNAGPGGGQHRAPAQHVPVPRPKRYWVMKSPMSRTVIWLRSRCCRAC